MDKLGTVPRIVVTGPTGWIGTAMLAHLARRFGPGWSDHVALFGSSARSVRASDGAQLPMRPLAELGPAQVDGAVVIHLAYLTREKVALLGERVFTDTNLAIDDHLFEALQSGRPRALFVASSGAAAMAQRGEGREPYGLSKLRQEDRFLAWSARTGVPALVGRIFNLAGPYINKVESYAIGNFALQARRTGEIRIEALVPVFRSFLHVDDLCGLILDAALGGIGRGSPIDLCGAEILEMSDIAAAVSARIGGNVTISRADVDWLRPSVYLGDFVQTKVLAMELGAALSSFDRQIADTLGWIDKDDGNRLTSR